MTTAQHSTTEREATQRANLASMLSNSVTRDDILDNEAKTLRYLSYDHLADLIEDAIEQRDREAQDDLDQRNRDYPGNELDKVDELDELDELDAEPAPQAPRKPTKRKKPTKPTGKTSKAKPARTFTVPPPSTRPTETTPRVIHYNSGTAGDIINRKHKANSSKTIAIEWSDESGNVIHRMMLGSVQADMISRLAFADLMKLRKPEPAPSTK